MNDIDVVYWCNLRKCHVSIPRAYQLWELRRDRLIVSAVVYNKPFHGHDQAVPASCLITSFNCKRSSGNHIHIQYYNFNSFAKSLTACITCPGCSSGIKCPDSRIACPRTDTARFCHSSNTGASLRLPLSPHKSCNGT